MDKPLTPKWCSMTFLAPVFDRAGSSMNVQFYVNVSDTVPRRAVGDWNEQTAMQCSALPAAVPTGEQLVGGHGVGARGPPPP